MTILLGAALAGIAVGWLGLEMLSMAGRDLATQAQAWDFETRRLIRLRDGSLVFRWIQPLIDEIKRKDHIVVCKVTLGVPPRLSR